MRTLARADLAPFFGPMLIRKGLQNLYDRIERMRNLGPEFIDITWCVVSPQVLQQTRAEWQGRGREECRSHLELGASLPGDDRYRVLHALVLHRE
jgi:hypothetical protein